jgi:hypothetical protein
VQCGDSSIVCSGGLTPGPTGSCTGASRSRVSAELILALTVCDNHCTVVRSSSGSSHWIPLSSGYHCKDATVLVA